MFTCPACSRILNLLVQLSQWKTQILTPFLYTLGKGTLFKGTLKFPAGKLGLRMFVKVAQLCLTRCNLVNYTVHGILHARILELVAFPFTRGSSQPRDQAQVSHIAGGFFTSWATRKKVKSEVAQSCPTLCDPMDCSLPASSIRGIFQARMLEWVAVSFSRGSSLPRDQTCVSYVSCIGRWALYH